MDAAGKTHPKRGESKMSAFKYIIFVIGTFIKLSLFLLVCFVLRYVCPMITEYYAGYYLPSAAVCFVTLLFLAIVEENKRSFFATGYAVENIIAGSASGFAVILVAMAAQWLLGNLKVDGFAVSIYPYDAIADAFLKGFFPAVVFFGYFFHIIMSDFGSIPASIISTLCYTAYECFVDHYYISDIILAKDFTDPLLIPMLLNFILTGAISSLLIIHIGDMRSATAFLTFLALTKSLVPVALTATLNGRALRYNSLDSEFILTMVLGVFFVLLLFSALDRER